MPKYIVRPYYGYDCDSQMGFNNGCYLPKIEISANTSEDAIAKAMQAYIEENYPDGLPKDIEQNGWFGENTLYEQGPITDSDGNMVDDTADDFEYDESKHGYWYKYIDFSNVEEVKE